MLPDWLQELRLSEITDRVKNDPTGETVFGIDSNTAMHEAAGWGQADFDEPWRELSPDDRVLLYAYFFQRGHLEELLTAFEQLFGDSERPQNPLVVDVGCGPFTGGLAIANQFPHDAQMDYVGVDRSSAMRRLGERLAAAAGMVRELPRVRRHWAAAVPAVSWNEAPGWRPVIVIVSYLFASPTLNVEALVNDLDDILIPKLGRGPVTVLYTNSIRDDANRGFEAFSTMLCDRRFELIEDGKGNIPVERGYGSRNRPIRYALFNRLSNRTLNLG